MALTADARGSAVPLSAVSPAAVGANNGDQSKVWEFHTTLGYLTREPLPLSDNSPLTHVAPCRS